MERRASIPLVFIFLFSVFSNTSLKAASLYAGGGYSYGAVIAESEYYNGASDWAPMLNLGVAFDVISAEFFLRKLNLDKTHRAQGSKFEITAEDLQWGLGLRMAVADYLSFNLGVNNQDIQTEYTSSKKSKKVKDPINKSYFSYFVGGGIFKEVYPNLIGRIDFHYHKAELEFGIISVDFTLVYNFLTF